MRFAVVVAAMVFNLFLTSGVLCTSRAPPADFIQALREQVEQLQRRGGHGPGPSSSMQSLRELGGSDDSDDDSDQEGGQVNNDHRRSGGGVGLYPASTKGKNISLLGVARDCDKGALRTQWEVIFSCNRPVTR